MDYSAAVTALLLQRASDISPGFSQAASNQGVATHRRARLLLQMSNPERPRLVLLLLTMLAALMTVHLTSLILKHKLCEKYAVEVLRGLREAPQPRHEDFSVSCREITVDFDKATDKYLAVIVSLLSGAAIGRGVGR